MLLFERSSSGRGSKILPDSDVEEYTFSSEIERKSSLDLPEVSEVDLNRHYSTLSDNTRGVNDGFYPLGSCTMKYNPKVHEEIAADPNFNNIHPLQPEETVQGALEAYYLADKAFCEITGMDQMIFQPAAGAQGELTGILLIKAYHTKRGDTKRNKIIIPESAHGTNPATASMAGYEVISLPADEEGNLLIEALEEACGDDIAGLMLTNPSTAGLFDKNVKKITQLIHDCGGLCYYDGANLNAIMGVVRPGDMGFDVVHLNLHKSFSTPHGGGGPGCGAVGCKEMLKDFLPGKYAVKEDNGYRFKKSDHSIGDMKAFYGNFLVMIRALAYVMTLGKDGIREVAYNSVLNTNYMMKKLEDIFPMGYDICMHEFVISLEDLKKETGVSALDFAKRLLDYNMHPPTMYFPLNIPEALMIEPTETESREMLDWAIDVFRKVYEEAHTDPQLLHDAPHNRLIKRVDEVQAARHPILRYVEDTGDEHDGD